jgi:hypothetical protein
MDGGPRLVMMKNGGMKLIFLNGCSTRHGVKEGTPVSAVWRPRLTSFPGALAAGPPGLSPFSAATFSEAAAWNDPVSESQPVKDQISANAPRREYHTRLRIDSVFIVSVPHIIGK